MDVLMLFFTAVSAVAAVVAVRFARDAVRETGRLRREDRLARLAEALAEFGDYALDSGNVTPRYTIRRARPAALLGPLPDPLPNCRLLAEGEEFDDPAALGGERKPRIAEVTGDALDELAELMRSESATRPDVS